MFSWLSPLIEPLEKVSIPLLTAVALFLSILVFSPDSIQNSLGVSEAVEKWRAYLGTSWLLAVSLLSMRFLTIFLSRSQKFFADRKSRKRRIQLLEQLTEEEKGYLVQFIEFGKNTIYVGLDDGIMGGLVAKRICYQATGQYDVLKGMAFNLQPWARAHLGEKPELLFGATGEPLTPQQKMRSDGW